MEFDTAKSLREGVRILNALFKREREEMKFHIHFLFWRVIQVRRVGLSKSPDVRGRQFALEIYWSWLSWSTSILCGLGLLRRRHLVRTDWLCFKAFLGGIGWGWMEICVEALKQIVEMEGYHRRTQPCNTSNHAYSREQYLNMIQNWTNVHGKETYIIFLFLIISSYRVRVIVFNYRSLS